MASGDQYRQDSPALLMCVSYWEIRIQFLFHENGKSGVLVNFYRKHPDHILVKNIQTSIAINSSDNESYYYPSREGMA